MRPTNELKTRAYFGSGGIVYGVIGNAHYFTLVFYSQVLGLAPELAGMALAIGLVIDAVTDPLVGYLSDNTQSRLGRRHPYLYASVIPLAASYFLLWHPPQTIQGDWELFTWLLVINASLRFSTTLFLIPAYALLAEITSDYEERTRLLTVYHSVLSVIGNGFSVLMYAIWLVPTEQYADGVLNVEGYKEAGAYGAVMIAAAILIFTVGLHKFVPRSRQLAIQQPVSLKQFYVQVRDVISNKAMHVVITSGMLYYAGTGTYRVMWVYMYSYFWEFTSIQISLIVIPMALGGLLLPPILARFAAGREKKVVAMLGLMGAIATNVVPITLRLLGFWPENGSELLFWTMLFMGFFETVLFLFFDVAWRSMTADITEQTQIETGRRNEGVISSAVTFCAKCSDAIGSLLAGTLLAIVAFPTETGVGDVDDSIIFNLGLIYGPLIAAIWLGATYAISRYNISRLDHVASVERLEGS
jgi:Na+/melibiose symporter-like transporter